MLHSLENMPIFIATAEDYFAHANKLFKEGNPEQAIKLYTRALELDPTFANAYINRALATYAVHKEERLIDILLDYKHAIELNPNSPNVYNNRGILYFSLGNIENAIVDYSKAIELDPTLITAYNNRAKAFLKLEKLPEAIQDYYTILKLNPEDTIAKNEFIDLVNKHSEETLLNAISEMHDKQAKTFLFKSCFIKEMPLGNRFNGSALLPDIQYHLARLDFIFVPNFFAPERQDWNDVCVDRIFKL